jgi:Ion channel
MTDYALTPSLRRLRSALAIVSVDPERRNAHPELVDARHQEADAVRVGGVLDQELHHRDEVPDLRGIVERGVHRDDRVIGRGARKIDALYFTVTTLTTTGFGDITMEDPAGRLLAVLIMIFGVSLFIRLAQTLFRPTKVHFECPDCGLTRHDADAVHCKHCGKVIHIETEGLD